MKNAEIDANLRRIIRHKIAVRDFFFLPFPTVYVVVRVS